MRAVQWMVTYQERKNFNKKSHWIHFGFVIFLTTKNMTGTRNWGRRKLCNVRDESTYRLVFVSVRPFIRVGALSRGRASSSVEGWRNHWPPRLHQWGPGHARLGPIAGPRGSFRPPREGLSGIPTIKTLITDIEAGPGCRVTDQGLQNKPKIRYFLFQDNETAPFPPSRACSPPRPCLACK